MSRHAESNPPLRATEPGAVPAAVTRAASVWVARRDAGLSEEERRDYAEWLAADPRHRGAIARLDFAWDALDRPREADQADVALGELARRARSRRRRRTMAGAAAALVFVLGLAAGRRALRPPDTTGPGSAVTASVLLPSLRPLPDGSVAEVRDGGEIDVRFSAAERRVELTRGTAYFKVARDAARPFVVMAAGVEFRAVGTEFSVQRGSRSVELLVTEGTVAVEVAPVEAGTPVLVDAGKGVSLDLAAGRQSVQVAVVTAPEAEAKLAWRDPRLEFSGTPLIEVVALMNRYNRWQFVIADPELAGVRVSGTFGATHADAFVSVLEAGFEVQCERRAGHEILLRRRR